MQYSCYNHNFNLSICTPKSCEFYCECLKWHKKQCSTSTFPDVEYDGDEDDDFEMDVLVTDEDIR